MTIAFKIKSYALLIFSKLLISEYTFMKSISFGKRLTEVRKNKKLSRDEVGKLVGMHGAIIGRYERDEVKPSIKMAARLAEGSSNFR